MRGGRSHDSPVQNTGQGGVRGDRSGEPRTSAVLRGGFGLELCVLQGRASGPSSCAKRGLPGGAAGPGPHLPSQLRVLSRHLPPLSALPSLSVKWDSGINNHTCLAILVRIK